MIETSAVISGTTARNEPNTNASTISAPRPPIIDSASKLGPLVDPVCSASASSPVR